MAVSKVNHSLKSHISRKQKGLLILNFAWLPVHPGLYLSLCLYFLHIEDIMNLPSTTSEKLVWAREGYKRNLHISALGASLSAKNWWHSGRPTPCHMAAMCLAINVEPIVELKAQLHKHFPNMDVWHCLTPWEPADHHYVITQIFSYLLLFYWLSYGCFKKTGGTGLLRTSGTCRIARLYPDLDE